MLNGVVLLSASWIRRPLCSSLGYDVPGFSKLQAEFVSADFSNRCYHTQMPLFCQSILPNRKPFAGLFLPLLHCTQNFQTCHFGKLIQDINLFQTTGKPSLLSFVFFFFFNKTLQYLCLSCSCAEAEMDPEGNITFWPAWWGHSLPFKNEMKGLEDWIMEVKQ